MGFLLGSVLVLFIGIAIPIYGEEFEVISTTSGKVKGIHVNSDIGNVVQFRHIPYAKPPVGDLRFRKPEAIEPWDYVLDSTVYGPSCVQNLDFMEGFKPYLPNLEISEDCLSLSIYVPFKVYNDMGRSVMIFIHGGGFFIGQHSLYDSSDIALLGDVIVVNINYRIGIFGFLSTEDAASPGNYGLWDQIMAFKWVKANIAAFGGDPESITIFGESAGSFCASYHMMIPQNKGLFKRVIAQSGVGTSFFPLKSNPMDVTRKLGQKFNCTESSGSADDSFHLVQCLREASSEDLLQMQNMVVYETMFSNKLATVSTTWPSVDGELFRDRNPGKQLGEPSPMREFFRSIDFLAGTTDAEGIVSLMGIMGFQQSLQFNMTEGIPTALLCDVIAPAFAEDFFHDTSGTVSNVLCEHYRSDDKEQQGRNVVDILGDINFVAPLVETLKMHSKENDFTSTYQYLFTKPASVSVLGIVPPWDSQRSSHGSDLQYLFRFKALYDPLLNEKEGLLFKRMVKYWSNFAKNGNPNGSDLPNWPKYSSNDEGYLNLNLEVSSASKVFEDRMTLLLETIPKLVEQAKEQQRKTEL